jgi:polar amino acid transport system substrate-binding protein
MLGSGLSQLCRGVALALFLSCAATASAQAECGQPITWAWNDFPPYAYRAADGSLKGLDVEIVERVLAEAGCTGEAVELPAKRALVELERGKVDLVAAASITPERQEFGYFSTSYRDERVVIFMRAEHLNRPLLTKSEDLFRLQPRLVANLGGFYGDTLAGYEQANKGLVERNPSIEDRFRMTAMGRVDGVVEDEIAGADVAKRLGHDHELAAAPIILQEAPVYLLMSKASVTPAQVAAIDEAIERLRAAGTLEQIINTYRLPTD